MIIQDELNILLIMRLSVVNADNISYDKGNGDDNYDNYVDNRNDNVDKRKVAIMIMTPIVIVKLMIMITMTIITDNNSIQK